MKKDVDGPASSCSADPFEHINGHGDRYAADSHDKDQLSILALLLIYQADFTIQL